MSTNWPWGKCSRCGGDLDPSGMCLNWCFDTEPDTCDLCHKESSSLVQSEDGFDLCPSCGFTDAKGRRFGDKSLAIKFNS